MLAWVIIFVAFTFGRGCPSSRTPSKQLSQIKIHDALATTCYVGINTHYCAFFWTLIHIMTYVAQGI